MEQLYDAVLEVEAVFARPELVRPTRPGHLAEPQ
jgi:hypothetical protein